MVETAPERSIAYFSMEIALAEGMPTYSGGLGVSAGDTVRTAADRKLPLAAVTLLYHKGYFYQRLDASGWQREEPVQWRVEDFLKELPPEFPSPSRVGWSSCALGNTRSRESEAVST